MGDAFTHAICGRCWNERNADRPFTKGRDGRGAPERCCFCGWSTNSGLYIRGENPSDCQGHANVISDEPGRFAISNVAAEPGRFFAFPTIVKPVGNCDGTGVFRWRDRDDEPREFLDTPCPGCRACK